MNEQAIEHANEEANPNTVDLDTPITRGDQIIN